MVGRRQGRHLVPVSRVLKEEELDLLSNLETRYKHSVVFVVQQTYFGWAQSTAPFGRELCAARSS